MTLTINGSRPLREMMTLRDAMDRLFDDSFVNQGQWFSTTGNGSRYLPIDVYETPDDIVVRAYVPGVTPENIDVNYQQGVLTLRAKSTPPETQESWRWYVHEISAGEVIRQVTLPREVDTDHADAAFEHGVLTLRLPKTPEAKPRQIKIGNGTHQLESGSTS